MVKEAINLKGPEVAVKIIDVAIPKPDKGQIILKNVVSGSNPKDWVRRWS
jgi:NADPH2:quinone reductase